MHMLLHVLNIPHSFSPCKGISSVSHISFDKLIQSIFSLIILHSEFHEGHLKLRNDTKEKSGAEKRAELYEVLGVSVAQSNAVSSN